MWPSKTELHCGQLWESHFTSLGLKVSSSVKWCYLPVIHFWWNSLWKGFAIIERALALKLVSHILVLAVLLFSCLHLVSHRLWGVSSERSEKLILKVPILPNSSVRLDITSGVHVHITQSKQSNHGDFVVFVVEPNWYSLLKSGVHPGVACNPAYN